MTTSRTYNQYTYTNYPITPEEFSTWLDSKRPRQIAGLRQSASSCPIAHYLKDKGAVRVLVSYQTISINTRQGGSYDIYDTPIWVNHYLDKIDNYHRGRYYPLAITVHRAQLLLKEVIS